MPLDQTNLKGFITPDSDFGLETSRTTFPVQEMALTAHRFTSKDDESVSYGENVEAFSRGHKAVVRTDTNEFVGVVSSSYKLMTNQEYFGTIEEAVRRAVPEELLDGAVVRDRSTGMWSQREYVLPAYAQALRNSQHETKMGLRIIASNSYDGSSSARLMVGLIDFYCTNGMIIGKNIEKSARRHTARLAPDLFVSPLIRSIETTNSMIEEYQQMLDTRLQYDAAVEFFEKNFSGKRSAQMMERLGVEIEDRGNNVFALMSTLTYYSSHLDKHFPARGDGNERMLEGREDEVLRLTSSPAFRKLMEPA